MDVAFYIVGFICVACVIALAAVSIQCGKYMRERAQLDYELIESLAEKVAANTDLQLERIRIEAKSAEATALAASEYTALLTRRNGMPPTEEELEQEIASRG